jgi:hypothetical protein
VPPGVGCGGLLGEQAELAGAGDGLGAVGRAELAQQVADVLLTVSRVTTSSAAMRGFGMPAASSTRISSSRPASSSARPGTGPAPRRATCTLARGHGAWAALSCPAPSSEDSTRTGTFG